MKFTEVSFVKPCLNSDVVSVLIDALHGLSAAHQLTDEDGKPLKLVHRDVSPHNILVGTDGIARLTDFGVAKADVRMAAVDEVDDPAILLEMVRTDPDPEVRGHALSRLDDGRVFEGQWKANRFILRMPTAKPPAGSEK